MSRWLAPRKRRHWSIGGCAFAASADRPMTKAAVLWDPGFCRSVLPVVALSPSLSRATGSFSLPAGVEVFVLVASLGLEDVLVLRGPRFVQLAVTGASVLSPCRLLTDLVLPPGKEQVRLAAVAEFNALIAGGGLDANRSRDLVGARRLRVILQALDGSLAGHSQRRIAESLFGAARVQRDWSRADMYLRDHVRRAVRRGRALMAGGYVSLLR
jgi:hypothetical protein